MQQSQFHTVLMLSMFWVCRTSPALPTTRSNPLAITVPTFDVVRSVLDRVSEIEREQVMNQPHGMTEHLRAKNPDRMLVAGKRYNQIGTVLYGFEHMGRDVSTEELARQLGLQDKQVTNAVSKINALISPVFGLKIERVRNNGAYTGQLRLTNYEDAKQAVDAYKARIKKAGPDLTKTLQAYENNGGSIQDLETELVPLMELTQILKPLLPAAEPAPDQEPAELF